MNKVHQQNDTNFNPLDFPIIFSFPGRLVEPRPWIEHIPFVMYLVSILRPRIIVELGTHTGNSYCAFCQSVQELKFDTKCYAVDTWKGDPHSGYYDEEIFNNLRNYNDSHFKDFSQLIRSTFDEAVYKFADCSVDLLHIDGFHSYEAVKHDFETWLPKLSQRGVVLFHNTSERGNDFGIWKLWDELKSIYPSFELIHGHGLGVLAVGSKYPPTLEMLLKSSMETSKIREFFYYLGHGLDRELSIQALTTQLADTQTQLADTQTQLAEIFKSKVYKISLILRRIRIFLLPTGSKRFKLARVVFKDLKLWRTKGFMTLINKMWERVTNKNKSWDYYKWINTNEPGKTELIKQRDSNKLFPYFPLISIIVPVFNTNENVLQDTLDSVLNQTYTNWQLCIANGSPEAAEIIRLLKKYEERDKRIHLVTLEKNFGIAGNTNAAISLATGQYIAFLDHDDCLAPFALYEVVSAINSYPKTDVLYSDEDFLNNNGRIRYEPHFKSAFNLELLHSINFLCHFLVIRKTIGDKLGWLREGFEGAQDFDLTLRVIEKSRWVTHIPKVLYHWRAISSSTACITNEKKYATKSGILALQDHMRRLGISAKVQQTKYPTTYKITYSISSNPMVSIIIPNQDHADDLRRCVNSILKKSTYLNYEIMIIENNSCKTETFNLYETLKKTPCVHVIEYHQQPFNYSRINNFAIKEVSGEILLLLNNDTEVINPDWLECMLQFAIQPKVGAVGAKLYYPDGSLQHGGVIIANYSGGVAGHMYKGAPRNFPGYYQRLILPQNLSAVTAACMMMRRHLFNLVAGFDEGFELAFGDVDLCLKLREKGYFNIWTPYAQLYHYESLTRGYEDTQEKIARFGKEIIYFNKKWKRIQELGDPYYNPNLIAAGNYDFTISENPNNLRPRCMPVRYYKE